MNLAFYVSPQAFCRLQSNFLPNFPRVPNRECILVLQFSEDVTPFLFDQYGFFFGLTCFFPLNSLTYDFFPLHPSKSQYVAPFQMSFDRKSVCPQLRWFANAFFFASFLCVLTSCLFQSVPFFNCKWVYTVSPRPVKNFPVPTLVN